MWFQHGSLDHIETECFPEREGRISNPSVIHSHFSPKIASVFPLEGYVTIGITVCLFPADLGFRHWGHSLESPGLPSPGINLHGVDSTFECPVSASGWDLEINLTVISS